jgi:hypothetical protein
MRHTYWISSFALVAAVALSSCRNDSQTAQATGNANTTTTTTYRAPELTIPASSNIHVTLGGGISSKTASVGDAWSGTVEQALVVDGRNVIPAGSPVSGTVTGAKAAQKGDRAMLDLGLSSVTIRDRTYRVHGTTEAVIAGSTRARNLGAIGAATAAGAVIGHAIGGSTKGTVIGAIVGGGAAAGAVSKTSGYQVELKPGTSLTFTTSEALAVRQ